MFWRDMLDPEEQIIYMSVYWRRIQGMDDEMKKSPDTASFAEMKTAIRVLDNLSNVPSMHLHSAMAS